MTKFFFSGFNGPSGFCRTRWFWALASVYFVAILGSQLLAMNFASTEFSIRVFQ
jgi:hypothetical protein